jgi:RHS repeat-associated protein
LTKKKSKRINFSLGFLSWKLQKKGNFNAKNFIRFYFSLKKVKLNEIFISLNMQSIRTYFYPKDYKLINHLGNVRAVFSDFKIVLDTDNIDNYSLDMESWGDYYPFGMPTPNRTYNAQKYRFGFQGQEKDNEWTGTEGSHLAFKYRIHDARIGRFLSIDPLTAKYPHNSPYAFSENSVISYRELEGLEKAFYATIMYSNREKTRLKVVDERTIITDQIYVTYKLNERNELYEIIVYKEPRHINPVKVFDMYLRGVDKFMDGIEVKNPKGIMVYGEGTRDDCWTAGAKTGLKNVWGTFDFKEFQEIITTVVQDLSSRKENSLNPSSEDFIPEILTESEKVRRGVIDRFNSLTDVYDVNELTGTKPDPEIDMIKVKRTHQHRTGGEKSGTGWWHWTSEEIWVKPDEINTVTDRPLDTVYEKN